MVGEASSPLQVDVGKVVWRRRGPPGGGPPAHDGAPMRHGRQRRSLWAAAGGDAVVVEVGAVPRGALRAPRPPPPFQVLSVGLPWWLRW